MGTFLLQMILAVFLEGAWPPSFEMDSIHMAGLFQEAEQMEAPASEVWDREEAQGEEARPGLRSRSLFSSYVVGGVDCMDDGSYDQYVEGLGTYPEPDGSDQPDAQPDDFPDLFFCFMGLDVTDYTADQGDSAQYNRCKAFCSDRFYMEYPLDWYVGDTDACPMTFVPEWEEEASGQWIRDWREYFDDNLEGSIQEVQSYIEGGGINSYLEEVLKKPVSEGYELELRKEDSDWLLIYDLKKGEKEAAEIVVWCNLGKCMVRSWDVELNVDPLEDYGRIMVFQEWDTFDFSSRESIKAYIESADFLYRLLGTALEEDVEDEIIRFTTGSLTTLYHDFVSVDVGIMDIDLTEQLRQAVVYIPVSQPGQDNWVVVFEYFPGSLQEKGVANPQVREQVISTFVALPFYHWVEEGENLWEIAEIYGEDPGLAYEIASYKTNHIPQPDKIYPGQRVEIPLGVLFRRHHHVPVSEKVWGSAG